MFLHDFKERCPKIFYVLCAGCIALICFFCIFGGLGYVIGLIAKMGKLLLKEYDVIRLVPPEGL